MGTRKQREKQEDLWIAHTELASAPGHLFYQRLNELLEAEGFDELVEQRCAKFYAEKYGASVADAGNLLSGATDWVFRGHRGRAWHCLAVGGLTGAASFCGHRARRVHTRPLHDFAHAAADRRGHASRSIQLGVGGTGRSRAAERPTDRDRCDNF